MRVHDFTFKPVLPPSSLRGGERGLISKCDRNRDPRNRVNAGILHFFRLSFHAFSRPLNAL